MPEHDDEEQAERILQRLPRPRKPTGLTPMKAKRQKGRESPPAARE
ncbi:MAG: hypothetical protein ACM3ZV_07955 [Bacillota bacterium]